MDVITAAIDLATRSHAAINQMRKYTGDPYICHPRAVAAIVASVPHTPEMIAAAWLHDVVEDTPTTIEDVRAACGDMVADLVEWLTDVSKPSDGNRAARKALDRAHSAAAPPEAQTIKLADLIDNAQSIAEHDPSFAVTYRREKMELLKVMTKGDKTLYDRALTLVPVR